MPLDEEGAKWSCEPCMRGHRSSKCQHFDRLMMKVPKAGRPLAKCPHPKGTCSCEKVYAFMVRIPKGPTCLCRPLYQVPASSAAETPSVPATPRTPSLPPDPTTSISKTAAAGRIQKHTRKQSNFQNPSEKIIKALDSELTQAEHKNNFRRISEQPPTLDRSTIEPVSGSLDASSYNQSRILPKKVVAQSKPGGCCSAKSEPVTPAPEPQRSCCGGSATPQEEKEPFPSVPDNRTNPTWNDSLYNSENLSWNTQLPNNDFASQHNTYTTTNLTPSYYTNQPQSSQPTQTFHNLDRQYQANISGPPMHQFYLNTATYPFDMSLPFVDDSNHDCSCGDSCQCLGCASHPFNETTRQHVQEMGYMMTVKEDEENSDTSSPFVGLNSPPTMPSNVPSNPTLPLPTNTQPPFTGDNTLPSTFDNTINPPTFTRNQFMQPSEYYTLEYPVGLNLCSDITGTCQCGNDCNCVGCITHSGHDGVVLESMSAESQPMTSQAAPQQLFREYYSQNSDIPRSMDQYSPSALSPPVVETPLV